MTDKNQQNKLEHIINEGLNLKPRHTIAQDGLNIKVSQAVKQQQPKTQSGSSNNQGNVTQSEQSNPSK